MTLDKEYTAYYTFDLLLHYLFKCMTEIVKVQLPPLNIKHPNICTMYLEVIYSSPTHRVHRSLKDIHSLFQEWCVCTVIDHVTYSQINTFLLEMNGDNYSYIYN